MKNTLVIVCLFLILLGIYACNTNNEVTEGTNDISNASSYYPGAFDTRHLYDQSINNTIYSSREARLDRNDFINNVEYVVQRNRINFLDSTITELFLRRTTEGIYFAIDTSGLSEFIPDSILQEYQLSLQIDPEINVFSIPGITAGSWPAFKFNITANILGQNLTISIVEVTAHYEGEDPISTPALGDGQSAIKIRYNIKIRIPDPNNILTFLNPPVQEFNANAWYVKDVGLSKLEGNALLVNVLSQGSIDFEDSTITATELLNSYLIK